MHRYIIASNFFKNNFKKIYDKSVCTIGENATHSIIKNTLYNKYCGGENIEELRLTLNKLNKLNIGTLISYGLENARMRNLQETYNIIEQAVTIANNNTIKPIYALKITSIIDRDALIIATTSNETFYTIYYKLKKLVDIIIKNGCTVAIDAEDFEIQVAINKLAILLMYYYNTHEANVYNTYQTYLIGTNIKLKSDLRILQSQGIVFAAKLVKGAYLATDYIKYPTEIYNSKYGTNESYDHLASYLLQNNSYLIAATHNRESTEKIIMNKNYNKNMVLFGHLLGIADSLTNELLLNNHRVYKHVTYGDLSITIPYLIRRLHDNPNILSIQ